ncbi:Hypothetical protein POVN_LOCUS228 [uncultured virus]|nr:Hypothetical protein POVN_LOCUS228 [uncultured virus]
MPHVNGVCLSQVLVEATAIVPARISFVTAATHVDGLTPRATAFKGRGVVATGVTRSATTFKGAFKRDIKAPFSLLEARVLITIAIRDALKLHTATPIHNRGRAFVICGCNHRVAV